MAKREVRVREAAIAQLETALELYLAGKDVFSVITLAAAAEEILGKELQAAGSPTALMSAQAVADLIEKRFGRDGVTMKSAASFLNQARNSLKHLDPSSPRVVWMDPESEARDMLERAVVNCCRLAGDLSERMQEFERRHNK